MQICRKCLNADICALHEDNFMADAIKNGFCGKFRNKEHYIHAPCKIGDIVWDKEGKPLKVLTIEQFPKDIHLHCEYHLPTGGRKTLYVGKHSIGRSVFLTYESFLERRTKKRESESRE